DKNSAAGEFTFKVKDPSVVKIAYQTVYVNADGETIHTQALIHELDFLATYIRDRLASNDPPYRIKKAPHKAFKRTLNEARTYTIDMIAADQSQLDPYLYLENAAGDIVARDDDSGGGLNARIIYVPSKDEEFTIIASAFQGQGAFTLKISERVF